MPENLAPLFVLAGPPASGKTTTAKALAQHFARAVHIPVDDLREMVVSGRTDPDATEWRPQLAEQVRLARETALQMAVRYRAAGFTVVIDDFLDPLVLTEYQVLAGQPGVLLVCLAPPVEVSVERNGVRGVPEYARAKIEEGVRFVHGLLDQHAATLSSAGWTLVDNSLGTVDELASRLAAMPSAGAEPGAVSRRTGSR